MALRFKRPELVDGFARQFRGDAGEYRARKEYLAIGVGDVPTCSTVAYEQTGVATHEEATKHDVASTPEFTEFTEFTVDAHIGPHASIPEARAIHPPPPEPVQKRPASHPGADPDAPKPARTDVQIVSSASKTITTDDDEKDEGDEGETTVDKTAVLARVTLQTGRTHQIRLHMAHANLPVLSDPLYGPHVRWDRAVPCDDASTSDVMPAEVRSETWGGALWLGRQALHARRLTLRHPGTRTEMTFEAAMPEDMRGACVALGLDPDAA